MFEPSYSSLKMLAIINKIVFEPSYSSLKILATSLGFYKWVAFLVICDTQDKATGYDVRMKDVSDIFSCR